MTIDPSLQQKRNLKTRAAIPCEEELHKTVWIPSELFHPLTTHHKIYNWIRYKGSLTRHLKQLGFLTVQMIHQGWDYPHLDENAYLKMSLHEKFWARETLLCVNQKPFILARSLFPKSSLKGSWRFLPYLKNQPLGQFLFKNTHLKRSNFEFSQLRIDQLHHQKAKIVLADLEETLIARRSILYLKNRQLLVSEIFLPPLYESLKSN